MAASLSQHRCLCSMRGVQKPGQRLVMRPVPFGGSSSSSRTRSVQVFAKGKGRRSMMSPTAPSGQMVRPQIPEVDPDNEEFCVFTRATTGTYQNWIFVSISKGGAAANALVKSMQTSEWGRKLYSRTLIQNIASSVYKDKDAIIKGLKQNIRQTMQMSNMAPQVRIMEPLLNQPVSSFEFAFKVRDKSKPGEFQKAEGLTIIPREAETAQMPLDRLKQFFSPANLSSMFGGSSS